MHHQRCLGQDAASTEAIHAAITAPALSHAGMLKTSTQWPLNKRDVSVGRVDETLKGFIVGGSNVRSLVQIVLSS